MKKIAILFTMLMTFVLSFSFAACDANVSREEPLPGSYISIELPKTQFAVDETVFVNISVGLYDWSKIGDADLSFPEGWNWLVVIHNHERSDDYSNVTILAVLDCPPEPLDKYKYEMVNDKIEFNYHEDFDLPSEYFSEIEGRVAISLIRTDSDLDDLSNLFPSSAFYMTQMLEYTKNEDGITLSHEKKRW